MSSDGSEGKTHGLGRRDALKLGAVVGAGAMLSGCSVIGRRFVKPELAKNAALPEGSVDPVTRLVNRLSFGPIPGEIARVAAMGTASYVAEQLNPKEEEPTIVWARLNSLESLHVNASELADLPPEEILRQLQQAAIIRAVYSPHQLRERMVDFWSNHFNIYARKGNSVFFKPADELDTIRKHALGTFPALLRTSAHSPAMLQYLDNQVNRRKDGKGAGANENYARELMELHSLGVHGGYTQKDVQEVARCLTGWGIEERNVFERLVASDRKPRGSFRFDPEKHDKGEKVVLGVTIPAGRGIEDGDQVLEILSMHPMTARYISYKIARYFLGEGATADAWTARLSKSYLETKGDIKQMLRPLLLSDDLLKGQPVLKRPFDFAVSALRALNADTDGGKALQQHLAHMGQPLYQWPMPDGYPDRTAAWTGSLLARWNFATALAGASLPGTAVDLPALLKATGSKGSQTEKLAALVLGRKADAEDVKSLHETVAKHAEHVRTLREAKRDAAAECAALLIASPQFQWR